MKSINPIGVLVLVFFFVFALTANVSELLRSPFDYVASQFGQIKKNMQNTPSLRYPESVSLPLDGEQISDQWTGDKGHFVLISKKNQAVYSASLHHAPLLGTVAFTQRVKIMFEEQGPSGAWVLVYSEDGQFPIGWLPAESVVRPSQFQRMEYWDFDNMTYKKGQYLGEMHVSRKGYFSLTWKAKGNGLILNGKHVGKMYEYGNIIWAKKSTFSVWKDFFVRKQDALIQEFRFQHDPLLVTENVSLGPKLLSTK